MNKEDLPQDNGSLGKVTKEVCYVTDASGKYVTGLSSGWEVKSSALDAAWQDIAERSALARQKVLNGEASPILYFMEKCVMDMQTLAAYTGFWKWTIRRHLRPSGFRKLSGTALKKYAEAFNVQVEDLQTMTDPEEPKAGPHTNPGA